MTLPFRLFFLFFLTILFFAGYLYLNFSPSSVHILTLCPFWWGDRDQILKKKKKDSLFECRIIILSSLDGSLLQVACCCCCWRQNILSFSLLPLFPSSLLTYVPSFTVRGLLGAGEAGESCWWWCPGFCFFRFLLFQFLLCLPTAMQMTLIRVAWGTPTAAAPAAPALVHCPFDIFLLLFPFVHSFFLFVNDPSFDGRRSKLGNDDKMETESWKGCFPFPFPLECLWPW